MQFTNEFIVPAAPDAAWTLLTDVPKIAPCMPGATVTPLADGGYEGTVAVKVGPIKVTYRGTASFTQVDAGDHRMVLDARGTESSGKGSAAAVVTIDLVGEGPDKTKVLVDTQMQVTGKVAQFGRSAMADVGARLIGMFAANLEAMLSQQGERPPSVSGSELRMTPAEPELDALALAWPLIRRGAVVAGAFACGALITWLVTRYRPRRGPRGGARRAVRR
ncbi:carbon monoxide dehydrogenase subunit G [Planotetraspora thailandica]|uniref:Carbon monoxide dehydrogenase subunit G n=1 Tax=Planotetraspora thailandica TaxID=487172 RepID=A0A8J4DES3_9ACTN|nr:SRPBCC family protein [Planotetraspora thailandica]GII58547.1 carbon monoxide dehydrogenase subunit G [Planotetraspora thailandica]